MRRSTTFVAVGLMATLVAGCGGGGDSGDGDIVVAASVAQSGALASSGELVSNGYELAVDTINAAGGVDGRQIDLVLEDDRSDAGEVVRLYTKFLTEDRADALLSPYGSALAKPAAQLAERYKTPMVHSLTSAAAVFEDAQYNVGAGLPPASTLLAAVPQIAVDNGYSSIALVRNDLEAFADICGGVKAAADEAGIEVVSELSYAPDTSNFSSVALQTKEANPEAVVVCGAIQDSVGVVRAMNQQAFRPKLLGSTIVQDPSFAESLGDLADNVIGFTSWSADLPTEGNEEFTAAYEERFDTPANDISADAYAAVYALVAAMKETGGTDKEDVNDALHNLTLSSIVGEYAVDESGVQTGYQPVSTQLHAGKLEIVAPEDVATAELRLPY